MSGYWHFLLFLLVFLSSCLKEPASIEQDLEEVEWSGFSIVQVSYDSIRIESNNTILISERMVNEVILLETDSVGLVPKDTLFPSYVSSGEGFYLNFCFDMKIPREVLHYNFAVIYKTNEGNVQIDSTHLMLFYPYESSKVFIHANEIFPDFDIYLEDIDITDDFIVFHPGGPLGIYKYNFETKQTTELVRYLSGDFISHDSDYIFFDDSHRYIKRYNLLTDTVDLEFDLTSFAYDDIIGLESGDGNVYVVFNRLFSQNYIGRFDLEGNYLDSIPYSDSKYCLTIESGIAYSRDNQSNLYRFNLSTNRFLPDRLAPVYSGAGIRIHGDRFYYIDWYKRIIGYVPLSEVR